MSHYSGNKNHHSKIQGLGQKVKYAAEIAGTVKTGFNLARGAYSLFTTVAPFLPIL